MGRSIRLLRLWGQGGVEGLHLGLERGDMGRDDIPDLVEIDVEVVVDEDMSHRRDALPWHFRMGLLEITRDPPGRLADDLDVPEQVGL